MPNLSRILRAISLRVFLPAFLFSLLFSVRIQTCAAALSSDKVSPDKTASVSDEAASLWKSANDAMAQKQHQKAQGLMERLLTLYLSAHGEEHENTARALHNLGSVSIQLQNPAQAKEYYERALAICLKLFGEEHGQTADNLHGLGIASFQLQNPTQAKEYYERALTIRLKLFGEEHIKTAESLMILGLCSIDLGDYETGIEYCDRSLAGFIKNADGERAALFLENLGDTARFYTDYARAREYYERTLAVRRKISGEDHDATANTRYRLATVFSRLGDFAQAKECYERALKTFLTLYGEEHITIANSYHNLGTLCNTLGDYAQSKEYHERALAVRLKLFGEEHSDAAVSYDSLGVTFQALGDFERAKEHYERALAIYLKLFGEEDLNTAFALGHMGSIFRSLGDTAQAKEYYERGLAVRLKLRGENHPETADFLHNLGIVYGESGDEVGAKEYYERSLVVYIKVFGEGHLRTANPLHNLGNIDSDLGNYESAKQYYERVLEIRLRFFGVNHPDTAEILRSLGILYSDMGLEETSVFYRKMAVNVLQSLRSNLTVLDQNLQKSFLRTKENTYYGLSDLLVRQGRIPEAQQVLTMLKEEEYFDFIRRNATEDPRSTTASYTPREQKQADNLGEIAGNLFALAQDRERLRQKKKGAEWDSAADAERLAEVENSLKNASAAFNSFLTNLDGELRAGSDAERRDEIAGMNLDSLQSLRRTLKDMGHGAVLLHTVIMEERLVLLLTTPEVQIARESPIRREELFEKIMAFREALEQRRDVLPMARELYGLLIAPVAEDLRNSGAETLMISLDGQLRYIPVAALHDGEKWLVEKYALALYTEAAKDKLKDEQSVNEWEIAAMGVTKEHRGFAALPAVRGELESIVRKEGDRGAAGIPGTIRLDEEFTESVFADALYEGVPAVHVASHFRFMPGTVSDSFLLLGDGKPLTLEAINNGIYAFGNVEQLTFSACNTAMGAGEGEGTGREVEGLGVLAQKQGAKSVAATLWSVADDSTGIFMARFYTLLQEEGTTKAEALRRAQLEFIEGKAGGEFDSSGGRGRPLTAGARQEAGEASSQSRDYRHPFFWAPFILMGNWL